MPMVVGSPEHRAAVEDLERGLGPFDDPAWRADLASLASSMRGAAVQWAVDALTLHTLACRVPRCAGDDRGGTPWTSFVREVAVARRISDVAAHAEVALSTSLVTRHPLTLNGLTAGKAPAHRARALVRACLGLPDDIVTAVETALAARLDSLTPGRIESEVQRIALRLQPEIGAQQEAVATADRTASRRTLAHGQSEIVLTGPAAANQRWWTALTERARALKAAGDPRTLGALRYDLAISLDPRSGPGTDPLLEALGAGASTTDTGPDADIGAGTGAQTEPESDAAEPESEADIVADAVTGPAPEPTGPAPDPFGFRPPLTDDRRCLRPVQAQITVPASTALGLDDEPGWLDGHGWISAPLSRELLTLAELRKACLHPVTGQLIDQADHVVRPARTPTALRHALHDLVLTPHALRPLVVDSQDQHDPSPGLEAFVQARDRYCDGPTGTAVPATRTDTDHHEPWPTGPTAAANLHSRSPRTHQLKHYGWRPERTADGTWWTSPAGQTVLNPHRHNPPPPPPAPRARPPDPDRQAAHDHALTRPPPGTDLPLEAVEPPEPGTGPTSISSTTEDWPDDPPF
jgi:hypothetical protein